MTVVTDKIATLSRCTEGPARAEVLAASAVLLLVGAALYGSYVLHGGFYGDDWSVAGEYRLRGYWTTVGIEHSVLGGRPLSTLLVPLPYVLFGLHPALHLGLALALGIATSLSLFVLLRTLSIAPLHAAAIAVLSLLFPWSDSIRLWITGAVVASVSVCFFLVGLIIALHGLRRRGRAAAAMHGIAVGLYVLSVLTYEVAAAPAVIAGSLYLGRAPRRTAIRNWLADAIAVLVALAYALIATAGHRGVGSLAQRIGDLRRFVRESLLLLASSVFPAGSSSWLLRGLVLLVVSAIIVAAFVHFRRRSQAEPGYWLRIARVATLAIAATYFMFLGSYLHPWTPGGGTRINAVAGLAYCTLAYAIVAIGAHLVFGAERATAVTLVAAVAIAIGYGVRLLHDESSWRRAGDLQHVLLSRIDRGLPHLPAGSTLLTFGFPAETSPGVPIFDESWDLNGAVELRRDDPSLTAYPVWQGVEVRCGPTTLLVVGPGSYGRFIVRYGSAFMLDEPTGAHERIDSPARCRRALRTFRPGPYFAPPGDLSRSATKSSSS